MASHAGGALLSDSAPSTATFGGCDSGSDGAAPAVPALSLASPDPVRSNDSAAVSGAATTHFEITKVRHIIRSRSSTHSVDPRRASSLPGTVRSKFQNSAGSAVPSARPSASGRKLSRQRLSRRDVHGGAASTGPVAADATIAGGCISVGDPSISAVDVSISTVAAGTMSPAAGTETEVKKTPEPKRARSASRGAAASSSSAVRLISGPTYAVPLVSAGVFPQVTNGIASQPAGVYPQASGGACAEPAGVYPKVSDGASSVSVGVYPQMTGDVASASAGVYPQDALATSGVPAGVFPQATLDAFNHTLVGLRAELVEADGRSRNLERHLQESPSECDSLRKDVRARDEERDDFHRRLAASCQQSQHLKDQVVLCERRIDELTRHRDLAYAQTAHIAQRAADIEARAREEVAAMEGRTAISETALLEVYEVAQAQCLSAEQQRALMRERALQALQDKENIIESLKNQCHILANELTSVGAGLNAEVASRIALEAKLE